MMLATREGAGLLLLLVVVVTCHTATGNRTENGLDALRLQSLVNAGNVERTADRGDFFTAFRNQWMFVEYQRQDGQMALFNSVTCNLIGGTGQIGTRILTTSSSSATGTIFDDNVIVGKDKVMEFSPPAIGNRIRRH
nr:hypothetical protein BaRGS_006362 [Batillaria attramentaria]